MRSLQDAEAFRTGRLSNVSSCAPAVTQEDGTRLSFVSPHAILGDGYCIAAPDHLEGDCGDSELHGPFPKSAEALTYELQEDNDSVGFDTVSEY